MLLIKVKINIKLLLYHPQVRLKQLQLNVTTATYPVFIEFLIQERNFI